MQSVTELGEIKERGRNQGIPTPYGACYISTPEVIEVSQRIEWMADFIAEHFDTFKAAGASDVVYKLYWTGLQGNRELTPRELRKAPVWRFHFVSTIYKNLRTK
jgi:hypothetical protein